MVQFSQYLRGEYEAVKDALKERCNLYLQRSFQKTGNQEQRQGQCAQHRALIVMNDDAPDKSGKHHEPQKSVQYEHNAVFLYSGVKSFQISVQSFHDNLHSDVFS